jgi:hypothetical protein
MNTAALRVTALAATGPISSRSDLAAAALAAGLAGARAMWRLGGA